MQPPVRGQERAAGPGAGPRGGQPAGRLSFTLPSGSRLEVHARTCRFEGTLVWTSRLHRRPDADDGKDRDLARGLVARARREYGTVDRHPKDGPLTA